MIGDFFSAVIAKISAALEWFLNLFVIAFEALWFLVQDAACWPFDQVMDVVTSAIYAIDVSGLSGHLGAWSSLPAEIVNVLGLLGIGQAAAIIVLAITVRLVLQLIPFVRLGS